MPVLRFMGSLLNAQVSGCSILALLLIAATCPLAAWQLEERWPDPSGHTVSFVTVSPGVDLELLDWGGNGPPLLLLSGVGNTAHVYDEFAHQLTGRFRVVGLTRRGFGASGRATTGYDIASRVQDIHTVIDRLGFENPIMIGHSIAGEEMTRFAASHPTRVRAIVYLDAAYDHTQTPQVPGPDQPMTSRDKESVGRLNDWLARTMGHRYPEAEVRATGGVFDLKGGFVRDRTPSGAGRQVLESVERPDYRSVRVPTMAIYRPMTLRSLYPNAGTFDADDRELAERQVREARVWWQRSIDQYRDGAVNGRTVVLESGAHHVFLTNEAEVARLVLSFLAELPPR